MTKVLDKIIAHEDLQKVLYNHHSQFFHEEVYHRDISNPSVKSNQIKKYLHQILTNAIFEYYPCKDLLLVSKQKPNKDEWSTDKPFWLSLNANPYPQVSIDFCDLSLNYLSQMLFFSL